MFCNLKKTLTSFLLFMIACNVSYAATSTRLPVYQNIIKEIKLDYIDSMLEGTIELENGCRMDIVDYKTRDDNVMKTWHPGEAVVFEANVINDALILTASKPNDLSETKVQPYVVFDFVHSTKHALQIVEINDNGKFVKLSDNSVWEFSWYNKLSTKHWKVGERVLVSGKGNVNSYEFINLEAPVAQKVASARGQFIVH